MKKKMFVFVFIALLTLPTAALADFYGQGIQPPFPPGFPAGTAEGSGFRSDLFTYTSESSITFSYNFITGEDYPDDWENDWFGASILNTSTGDELDYAYLGDVSESISIFTTISATGPYGDVFIKETGTVTGTYTLPNEYAGLSVQFSIGVFDLEDVRVASALLIDNIKIVDSELNEVLLQGGDFTTGPFATGGYFDPNGGPIGLFEWMATGDLSGVTEPGSGSFAYISTYNETLVPIPGAVWLLGSGLIGLVGFRRKFRK